MPRAARVNVPIPAELYPALRELAQSLGLSAGAVVANLLSLYGEEYGRRQKEADEAALVLKGRILRGEA